MFARDTFFIRKFAESCNKFHCTVYIKVTADEKEAILMKRMKPVLYTFLLIAEAVLGIWTMLLVWNATAYIPCIITVAVWAALLVMQLLKWKKATEEDEKRKVRRRMPLVMFFPTLAFIIMVIVFIIRFMAVT